MNTAAQNKAESGQSLVSVIIGLALSVLVLGGLTSFYLTANAVALDSATHAASHSQLVQGVNRIGRDISDADRVVLVAPSEVVVDTGRSLIRWSIVDGDLGRQVAAHDVVDWNTASRQVTARGVSANTFDADPGSRLVHITLTSFDGSDEITTAAATLR